MDADEAPNTDGDADPNTGVEEPPASPSVEVGDVIRQDKPAIDMLDPFYGCRRGIGICRFSLSFLHIPPKLKPVPPKLMIAIRHLSRSACNRCMFCSRSFVEISGIDFLLRFCHQSSSTTAHVCHANLALHAIDRTPLMGWRICIRVHLCTWHTCTAKIQAESWDACTSVPLHGQLLARFLQLVCICI